jgi:hypothetical protein
MRPATVRAFGDAGHAAKAKKARSSGGASGLACSRTGLGVGAWASCASQSKRSVSKVCIVPVIHSLEQRPVNAKVPRLRSPPIPSYPTAPSR